MICYYLIFRFVQNELNPKMSILIGTQMIIYVISFGGIGGARYSIRMRAQLHNFETNR